MSNLTSPLKHGMGRIAIYYVSRYGGRLYAQWEISIKALKRLAIRRMINLWTKLKNLSRVEEEGPSISTGEKFIARSTEFAGGVVIRAVNCPIDNGKLSEDSLVDTYIGIYI